MPRRAGCLGSVVQNRSMLEFGGNFSNLKGFPGGSDGKSLPTMQVRSGFDP